MRVFFFSMKAKNTFAVVSVSAEKKKKEKKLLFALPKAKYFTTVTTVKHLLYLKYVIPDRSFSHSMTLNSNTLLFGRSYPVIR